ncbi:MAG: hypothetical protein PHW14_01870 [Candidatus Omnitrophica bacterium]|nr:hypothetical protein [Candidatus Omnitrophota bacterium]
MNRREKIIRIYDALESHFGDLGWWPADTPFEVMVGAVLTQNTAWANVAKAITRIKEKGLLSPQAMLRTTDSKLAERIRPAGYFRVKTKRLKELCRFLMNECGGDPGLFSRIGTGSLREKLLLVNGIGPETADSILLYALDRPVFVVDAYTRRIFGRHRIFSGEVSYDDLKDAGESAFSEDRKKLNQMHALIVETAKKYCKKNSPKCGKCPLFSFMPKGRAKSPEKTKRNKERTTKGNNGRKDIENSRRSGPGSR